MVGRFAGARLRHRRTVCTNGKGKPAGNATVSARSSGHVGARWVRASNKVMPRPQTSPAVENPESCSSGGSYKEVLLLPLAEVPIGRTVSVASFN